jgi:hypothetical protein
MAQYLSRLVQRAGPKEVRSLITLSRIMPTTFLRLLKHKKKRSTGPKRTVTRRTSRGFDISTIRRSQITGGRFDFERRGFGRDVNFLRSSAA